MTDHVNMMHRCRMEVWKRPGCTTWELAEVSGIDYWVLERRLPALRNSGKVRNGDNRVCRIKGRSCLTWFPAGDGADEYMREAAPTLAPLPSEQPPIDPALMSAPDPNIERELELGLFPKWITRAAIDDTKRVWSPSYKYALIPIPLNSRA